jgi:hypothetical protein
MSKPESKDLTLKFEQVSSQISGFVNRITGLVKVKHLIPLISELNLEANPRDSKVGPVTAAIRESLETTPETFPFKSKGILLAASEYTELERRRYSLKFNSPDLEGSLDGGHNTLAIGMYVLDLALGDEAPSQLKSVKLWQDFKILWDDSIDKIHSYTSSLTEDDTELSVLVPVELLVPADLDDQITVDDFNRSLLDICSARNNNVQLKTEAKANQHGYFESLKSALPSHLSKEVEWRPNEGGDIKVADIVALTWVPLRKLMESETFLDESNKKVEPVSAVQIYSSKGECVSRFERLMSSKTVSESANNGYARELRSPTVLSAMKIAGKMPELYDLIYELFPNAYNGQDGRFGRITPVKKMNAAKTKQTKFSQKAIDWRYPDGYIIPLVVGLETLMGIDPATGQIQWKTEPEAFIRKNLDDIVGKYKGIVEMVNYDPQKVGKASAAYAAASDAIELSLLKSK